MENIFKNHIIKFHTIGSYMISRDFKNLIHYIEEEYFSKKIFDHKYYTAADDFVFRMDITGLSYSNIFELAYKALNKKDYGQYLLGLKLIIVKLKGNQRYTYYDRNSVRETLNYIEEKYSLIGLYDENEDILDIIDAQTLKNCPVGFEKLSFEEYKQGSTSSIYKSARAMKERFYEEELRSAIDKGIIYHYIVEIDHYINADINSTTIYDWIFLAKLLAVYYTTEKKPWTRDMTKDMLRIYYNIMNCCEMQEFEEIVYKITTENLKFIIKKLSRQMHQNMAEEISDVINYLVNVFSIRRDERYIVYIKEFLVILETSSEQEKVNRVNDWLKTIS